MSSGTRSIPRRTLRAIHRLPCDGRPRFMVAGSQLAFHIPYSTAYDEIFVIAGGRFEDGLAPDSPKHRIFTPDAISRLTKLNQLYCSDPEVREFISGYHASMKAAQALLKRPEEQQPWPKIPNNPLPSTTAATSSS
jgi:hypothetical protein